MTRIRAFVQKHLSPVRRRNAYRHFFLSPDGQIVLADLAKATGFFDVISDVESENPYMVYYGAGRRAVYHYVLTQIDRPSEQLRRAEAGGLDQFEEEPDE